VEHEIWQTGGKSPKYLHSSHKACPCDLVVLVTSLLWLGQLWGTLSPEFIFLCSGSRAAQEGVVSSVSLAEDLFSWAEPPSIPPLCYHS
jgi:hypothetical protein